MKCPKIDPEMRELLDLMGKDIIPRSRRRAAVKVNDHAPYYSPNRYRYY